MCEENNNNKKNNPKKLGANPARGLLNKEKRTKY